MPCAFHKKAGGEFVSLIQCTSDCLYQKDGYCRLEKAAEITTSEKSAGCLHFRPRGAGKTGHTGPEAPKS